MNVTELIKNNYNYDFQPFTDSRRHYGSRSCNTGSAGADILSHRYGGQGRMAYACTSPSFGDRYLHLRKQVVDDPQGKQHQQEFHE
jgi:hypothetical protein